MPEQWISSAHGIVTLRFSCAVGTRDRIRTECPSQREARPILEVFSVARIHHRHERRPATPEISQSTPLQSGNFACLGRQVNRNGLRKHLGSCSRQGPT